MLHVRDAATEVPVLCQRGRRHADHFGKPRRPFPSRAAAALEPPASRLQLFGISTSLFGVLFSETSVSVITVYHRPWRSRKIRDIVPIMATRPIDIGDVGRTVAANVTRYRKRRGYSMRALAEELTTNGRTMSASAISQIENTARRVDVDDLFAIAVALDVTPDLLLMPEAHSGDDRVPSVFGETAAARIWAYLRLDPPPGDPLNEWWVDPQQTPTALMAKLFASSVMTRKPSRRLRGAGGFHRRTRGGQHADS